MPVHPASYALGIALAPLLISIPSLIFFGAITAYLGFLTLETLVWIVPALIIVWAAMSTMGFMISTYLMKSSTIMLNNLSNLLGIGLIFIPPVYFSEAQLGNLSWISVLIPTSNVAGLIRSSMGLLPLSIEVVIVRWVVLIITTLAFIMLTFIKARWREK
jgi:ABC-type multidrug transport system permease subunit